MPISTIGSNSLNQTSDLTINGQTVGKGGGNVATNTAHGVSALQANTSGGSITAIGYQAGYSNTTNSRSTFVGTYAGYSSTGVSNTFIGAQGASTGSGSGELVTTGAKNTIIGSYNGNQGGLDIRTLSNRVVLSDGDGNPRLYADNNGAWQSTSAVGDAVLYPAQFCRAWVNFNGTSGVTIRGSANVSSVTRTAAGQYTLNFSTSMPDVNYAAVGNAEYDGVSYGAYAKNFTTSSFIIQCINPALTAYSDKAYVCYSVFR